MRVIKFLTFFVLVLGLLSCNGNDSEFGPTITKPFESGCLPQLDGVTDFGVTDDNRLYFVMELLQGRLLSQALERSGALSLTEAVDIGLQLCSAMTAAHEAGLVHRDLKPENIIIQPDGILKLMDFGLARTVESRMTSEGNIMGTVHYMAPEIGAGCYNKSIDIYALGILLYEMLTGQVPYFGSSPAEVLMKHMTGEPDLTGVDETFARVIRKALAKNPEERYQTVQELVEDVFGEEHIRNSVSQFSAQDLSVVAERIAGKSKPRPGVMPGSAGSGSKQQAGSAGASKQKQGPSISLEEAEAKDPITKKQRLFLALISAAAKGQ